MAKSPPPPELVEAYQLIKSGQRQAAGKTLKTYLAKHPHDTNAWWLMAHAVTKDENVIRCLETVLKLDPDHTKAREKLASLKPPPAIQPDDALYDEPDDSMFFATGAPPPPPPAPTATAAPAPVVAPVSAPAGQATPAAQAAAGTFEEYLATTPTGIDPFAAPPPDNPFAGIPESVNPFEPVDPFAANATGSTSNRRAQAPGTGSQPTWGPGLAFTTEVGTPGGAAIPRPRSPQPTDQAGEMDFGAEPTPANTQMVVIIAGIAVMIVVLLMVLLYVADQRGTINLSGNKVPAMTKLDVSSFAIDAPKKWDLQCQYERMGYQVCGIANHPWYNQVDYYAGTDINIGAEMAEAFSLAWGASDLPDEQVSIIVMDVPRESPAYDDKSWAKTKYEWSQDGWFVSDSAEVTYEQQTDPPMNIDGYDAYFYKYVGEDKEAERDGWWGKDVAYDVYIPHDGLIFWMTVSISSDIKGKSYDHVIEAMIDSIDIKPMEEW